MSSELCENTSLIDSEESYHPEEEYSDDSSINESDVPSTSTSKRSSFRRPGVFTSTPKISTSRHRIRSSLPRFSSFEMDTSSQIGPKSKLSPGEEAIMQYLSKLEKKMDKLQDDLKAMREEQKQTADNKKGERREEQQKLYVPPRIRTAVHDAYKQLVEEDGAVRWQTKLEDCKLKASSEVNKATSQAVKNFVKGLYPDVQEGILQTAVARYFESVAQKDHKEKTGKVEEHKNKMLHYSRRKRKLQWRRSMLEKKTGWDEAKKRRMNDALVLSYMSSEDEHNTDDESFLKTKPLEWRSEEYVKLLDDLDSKYERSMSKRSRRQMMKRVKGDVPSTRQKPAQIKPGHEWVITH